MTVYDAIVLRLSEKRGGNTLPAKAIKTTAKYLSENVGLEDAQEFSFLDLPSIVDEAWEKIESEKTPDFVRRKVARWVNNDPGEKMGGDATVMVSADEEVEDTETICGPSGGNPRGLKTLAEDKLKQMLTGMRTQFHDAPAHARHQQAAHLWFCTWTCKLVVQHAVQLYGRTRLQLYGRT